MTIDPVMKWDMTVDDSRFMKIMQQAFSTQKQMQQNIASEVWGYMQTEGLAKTRQYIKKQWTALGNPYEGTVPPTYQHSETSVSMAKKVAESLFASLDFDEGDGSFDISFGADPDEQEGSRGANLGPLLMEGSSPFKYDEWTPGIVRSGLKHYKKTGISENWFNSRMLKTHPGFKRIPYDEYISDITEDFLNEQTATRIENAFKEFGFLDRRGK